MSLLNRFTQVLAPKVKLPKVLNGKDYPDFDINTSKLVGKDTWYLNTKMNEYSPLYKGAETISSTNRPAFTPITMMKPKGISNGLIETPTTKDDAIQSFIDNPRDVFIPKGPDEYDIALNDYNAAVDKSLKSSGIINAAKGLLNVGVIANELTRGKSNEFKSAQIKAPAFLSPGQYIRASQESGLSMMENTAQKLLQESGRSDTVIGVTADVLDKTNQVNAQAAAMDVEAANKSIDVATQAANQQALIDAETKNKNIEKAMQENMASGMTITQALNALGEIGTQYVAGMNEGDYKKWVARMMMAKIKMQRDLMASNQLPGMEDLTDGTVQLVPGQTTETTTTTDEGKTE